MGDQMKRRGLVVWSVGYTPSYTFLLLGYLRLRASIPASFHGSRFCRAPFGNLLHIKDEFVFGSISRTDRSREIQFILLGVKASGIRSVRKRSPIVDWFARARLRARDKKCHRGLFSSASCTRSQGSTHRLHRLCSRCHAPSTHWPDRHLRRSSYHKTLRSSVAEPGQDRSGRPGYDIGSDLFQQRVSV